MEFYRYVAVSYAQIDHEEGYGNSTGFRFSNMGVILQTYNLHKETPKGYWIGYGHPDNGLQSHSRWVSKTARKRHAYPTKEEAMTNFIKRSERRIKILKNQLDDCQTGLSIAKNMKL